MRSQRYGLLESWTSTDIRKLLGVPLGQDSHVEPYPKAWYHTIHEFSSDIDMAKIKSTVKAETSPDGLLGKVKRMESVYYKLVHSFGDAEITSRKKWVGHLESCSLGQNSSG